MGGQSSEREVSLKTGEAVYRSLVRSGYDAVAIDVGPDLSKTLQEQAVEIGFLALHGPGGEDGAIQGFLDPRHSLYGFRCPGQCHRDA